MILDGQDLDKKEESWRRKASNFLERYCVPEKIVQTFFSDDDSKKDPVHIYHKRLRRFSHQLAEAKKRNEPLSERPKLSSYNDEHDRDVPDSHRTSRRCRWACTFFTATVAAVFVYLVIYFYL